MPLALILAGWNVTAYNKRLSQAACSERRMIDEASKIDLERTLHESFGLERFRPGQREVIENVLAQRDVLCVMPTGGGKSLCYQLPALLLPGVTLVVSPLIALMKDQVDALAARGLSATLINSTLDLSEQSSRLADIERGRFSLVYVAPERFRSARFLEAMRRLKPALLAIDEAHCISEWGHDFRPDYARLGHARRVMGMPPCIALTATATDLVRRDISAQLNLKDPAQFVTGFDRPNLSYQVLGTSKDADKLATLAELLTAEPGPAIIYASSRKRCEEVAPFVEKELRRSVVIYHAGLDRDLRTRAQDRFMSGEVQTVVATNAFGMGVDKADIRSVIHYNMPGTLEAYYQEAGRAGRDGKPANCVLLYAASDRFLQEFFIENEYPPRDCIYRVYEFLRSLEVDPIELTQLDIKEAIGLDLNESAVGASLRILEGAGALERFRPRENMAIVRFKEEAEGITLADHLSPQAQKQRVVLSGLEGLVKGRLGEPIYFRPDEFAAALSIDRAALTRAIKALCNELPIDYIPPFRGNATRIIDRNRRARGLDIDFASLEKRKQEEYDKLDRMIRYSSSSHCRRAYILDYFGDKTARRCGNCDNCGQVGTRTGTPEFAVDTPFAREVVRKALSGVARAKGRFGKTTIAMMLTGSGADKLARTGLTKLSTFGILSEFKKSEVAQLLDALAGARLLEYTEVDRFRPIANVTAKGWDLIRGSSDFELALAIPDELAAKMRLSSANLPPATAKPTLAERVERAPREQRRDDRPETTPPAPSADSLRDALWKLRAQWAREANMTPGYLFSNETLEVLLNERPTTPHALGQIKGIGPAKLERFGAKLLAFFVAHAPAVPQSDAEATAPLFDQRPRPALSSPQSHNGQAPARSAESTPYVPTEEWTCRLLDRGFTLDEAAAIRGLERAAIVRHATLAARQGRALPISSLIGDDVLAEWTAWRKTHGDAPPPGAGDLWGLFLAAHRTN
jgi:ATP-dependent DNA helicase RecQ